MTVYGIWVPFKMHADVLRHGIKLRRGKDVPATIWAYSTRQSDAAAFVEAFRCHAPVATMQFWAIAPAWVNQAVRDGHALKMDGLMAITQDVPASALRGPVSYTTEGPGQLKRAIQLAARQLARKKRGEV